MPERLRVVRGGAHVGDALSMYRVLLRGISAVSSIDLWSTCTEKELCRIFREAARTLAHHDRSRYEEEMHEHYALPFWKRWWHEYRGWAPALPRTQREMEERIAYECNDFASKAELLKMRPSFWRVDLHHVIAKPRNVAILLLEQS